MPAHNVRVPGGYTVFHWGSDVIGFAQTIQVTSVQPVVGAAAIQPMNALRPLEIVTPRASTYGTIIVSRFELWNSSIWQDLAGLANSNDIIDIFEAVASQKNGITVTKYVRTPGSGADRNETFLNVVVTEIDDGETVSIDTMPTPKTMTLWYTKSIKSWINAPKRPDTFV